MSSLALGLAMRFLLGGLAVALSGWAGRRLGGLVGGLFAAFPAVYLAALLGVVTAGAPGLGDPEAAGLAVSRGALVGMLANVVTARAAAGAIGRWGWQKGMAAALAVWGVAALVIFRVFWMLT